MSVLVEDNPARRRFEILVDGCLVGFAVYELRQDTVVFLRTEINEAQQDRGIGNDLVRRALEQVRARGERVAAECPFVATYLERHPDYADLVVTID
ncbi:MAG: GNAT family N-acetyltransferase [Actinobacteria bacterium]|nr:MAG: GNAT family N-acetyltransferase [Actinomycetota bacterium]